MSSGVNLLRKIAFRLDDFAATARKNGTPGAANSAKLLAEAFWLYLTTDLTANPDGSISDAQQEAIDRLGVDIAAAILSFPASGGIATVSSQGVLRAGLGIGLTGLAGSAIAVVAVEIAVGAGLSFLIAAAINAARENGLTLIPENHDLSSLDGSGAPYRIIGSLLGDTIRASAFDDEIATLTGSDRIEMLGGSDLILAGEDGFSTDTVDYTNIVDDSIEVSAAGEFVRVVHGSDTDGLDGVEVLIGSDGDDKFVLTEGMDLERIEAGAGNDTFYYAGGDVVIDGGEGSRDTLEGPRGGGALEFDGQVTGIERLIGSSSNDTITITSNDQSLQTFSVDLGAGTDTLNITGTSSTDVAQIDGGEGVDTITVSGQWLFAAVRGGNGNDVITIDGNFRGIIEGGLGNDTITGGNLNDVLYGSSISGLRDGADTLTGGYGSDDYYVGDQDIIIATNDGAGDEIWFNGTKLTGPKDPDEGETGDPCDENSGNGEPSGPPWEGADGAMYEQSGSTLTITLNGATLTIQNFTNGDFGFEIPEEEENDDAGDESECNRDPFIIDLDGDGFEFQGITEGAYFDYGNDGFADRTAWVNGDDGILVTDLNGDGRIIGDAEVFNGEGGTIAMLTALDSNADGVLDASDAGFTDLLIWRDANADGITDEGELGSGLIKSSI